MSELKQKQHYGAIDGLRAFSAIGIVLMHVLSNGQYMVRGFLFEQIIPSFTNLVFLFMIVSGFSVCCGYYERFQNKELSFGEFFWKRVVKVWPFFAFWCIVDLILSPSIGAVYEVFANLTLCFGLIPKADISVIGVGWFLGVVFVFYMLFPFFCWLLTDKKRAWFSFVVALIFNYVSASRFGAERRDFAYSAVFFLAGGMIFLYKEQLGKFVRKWRVIVLLGVVLAAAYYYLVGSKVFVMLVLYSLMLIYTLAVEGKYYILENRVTKFLGGISMEIYLCHMVAFRVLEKLKLIHLFESEVLSFVVIAVGTFAVTVVMSVLVGMFLKLIGKKMKNIKRKYIPA